MKKIITLVAVAMICVPAVFAQDKPDKPRNDEGWKDKMQAEKIAFITEKVGLTPEEAQVFWPVYNKFSAAKQEVGKKVREAYKELREAIKANENIDAKLEAYVKAMDESKTSVSEELKAYKSILPIEKVAKFFTTEEEFRFQQIQRLHQGGPQGGPRPGMQGGPQMGPRKGGPQGPQDGKKPFEKGDENTPMPLQNPEK